MTTPTTVPPPAPTPDARVLVDVAENLPTLTGPNAALAVIREVSSGTWQRQIEAKAFLRDLRPEDITAFKTPAGEPTPASQILQAAHDLSQSPDVDPNLANIDSWLAENNTGVQVGRFAQTEQQQRGYQFPAHSVQELVHAQVQLATLRELTQLGVNADPVAGLQGDRQRMERAQQALTELAAENPQLNVDAAANYAQAKYAYQDAETSRDEKRQDLVAQVKGSAHTKSLAALGIVGAAGSAIMAAATDLPKAVAILVGVGLPAAYAVVDKALNRNKDPQAPKPVRDAGKAYKAAKENVRGAKQTMDSAQETLRSSFAPPTRQVGPGRGR